LDSNKRHPSQHTVGNVHKASGNCQQRRGNRKKSTVVFFLFPRLKSIMKSACFADVAAIQERVTAVLRSIPKEAFAGSFHKLHERFQQCIVKDGDYFESQ
jgi:hypothetical protein